MRDKLISFETAKLAKEKGANLEHRTGYTLEGGLTSTDEYVHETDDQILKEKYEINFYAPTQSLLQKWLREKHHIDVLPCLENIKHEEMYMVNISHKTKAIFP